jgi:O-antigen ligase
VASILAFAAAVVIACCLVLTLGVRRSVLLTPWVLTAGIFVIPGPTASYLPFSASWLLALACLFPRSQVRMQVLLHYTPALLFLLLLAMLAIQVVRSPDRGEGIRVVVQGSFVLWAALVGAVARRTAEQSELLRSLMFPACILSAAVFVFRTSPPIEAAFLHSQMGSLLIDPHTLDTVLHGYRFQGNNVLDPRKAGAVFVNANQAAAYLCALLGVAVAMLRAGNRQQWLLPAAIILALGAVSTGSRGALVIVALYLGISFLTSRRITAFGVLTIVAIVASLPTTIPTLKRLAVGSLLSDPRLLLWPLAFRHFLQQPLFGGGFGDWEAWLEPRLHTVGIVQVLPPHNLILQLLLWGGIAALGLFVVLIVVVARRVRRYAPSAPVRGTSAAFGLALSCMLFFSMFDNFFLFEWHIGPLLGLAYTTCLWQAQPQLAPLEQAHATSD